MFKNLMTELDRKRITQKAVAELIGCAPNTLTNKLYGRQEFTLSEVLSISENLLPEFDLHYLFHKDETKEEE